MSRRDREGEMDARLSANLSPSLSLLVPPAQGTPRTFSGIKPAVSKPPAQSTPERFREYNPL